ncbi:MAG: tetratricopeptide repeat protein [Candidatus Lokiarchaeota archaeon]|nr:tetratricopeptide repeat protein [Candidatus Lokiarchaeota archaeon]
MSHSEMKELIKAKNLIREGRIKEAHQIVLGLENYENLTAEELLLCKLLKANLLYRSMKYSDAIIYTDELFKESQKQGDLLTYLDALIIKSFANIMLGNVSESEDIIKKADNLFKKIKGTSTIDLRERKSFLVRIKANICTWRGEIHRSLELNKEAFELAKGSNNKELISGSLINIAEKYELLGDYDNAKLYAERALEIQYQPWLMYQLGFIIDILLDNGDIEEANNYFQQIIEIREKDKSKINDILYRYYKAVLLKTSLRSENRVKSEKLLKQIIDNEDISGGIKSFWAKKRIFTIINLCDLLLIELRITNYPEIIDEIQPYIQKLLDFAEQQHSYWILCETHLLQAKLSLLTFDIQKAKRFLTQGQQVAEKYGLKMLARKISNEHDELLKQLTIWEDLKKLEAPLTERLKLARLNEQMDNILRKRVVELDEIQDEESVVILIISKGGNPIFSQSFAKGWSFQDHLFGGFLSAVNSFSDEMFAQGLDRAIFGEYTIIMNVISPFIICYLFKGQSFLAQQRMKHFIDAIQNDNKIWEPIKKYYQANRLIQVKDIPSLDLLVNEVFVERAILLN